MKICNNMATIAIFFIAFSPVVGLITTIILSEMKGCDNLIKYFITAGGICLSISSILMLTSILIRPKFPVELYDIEIEAHYIDEAFDDCMEIELDELQDICYSPKRLNLSEEKQNLLNTQLSMENYAVVLLKRINDEENIPIPHYDPDCGCRWARFKDIRPIYEFIQNMKDQGIKTNMMP